MTNPMVAYHTEETIVPAIHRLLKNTSVCRVAVAYCGADAFLFFPENPASRPQDLRIIVDASESTVSRGLTNPKGLTHLLGLTTQLCSLESLHAKVFIFDDCSALVSSVNLSKNSVEGQYQLGLETWDKNLVKQLIAWFDNELWSKSIEITSEIIRKLTTKWPTHAFTPGGKITKGRLSPWRGEPPQPAPGPSEFKIGIGDSELQRLVHELKSNPCKYRNDEKTCWEVAIENEALYEDLGIKLRALMNRSRTWGKNDLADLFKIAYTNGRAAMMNISTFTNLAPNRVEQSMRFLFEGQGDAFVRFEKVLSVSSQYHLAGLGESGIIFLMHLWNPKKYAIVNASIDKALKLLNVSFGRATSRRRGQAFKDRTAAVEYIMKKTKLKSFGRVDHFLDAIGKGHIRRPI